MTARPVTDEDALNQPVPFDQVVAAARKRLFAVFDNPERGLAAIAELPSRDLIPGEQIWLLHCEEGLRRLDPSGRNHGLYGRYVRITQLTMSDDNLYVDALARALSNGALVIALPVAHADTADRIAELLETCSGHSFA